MSATSPVVIVDYGRGNLWSVCQAVARVGGVPTLSSDPEVIRRANRLILPGVGAFGDAMVALRAHGLDQALRDFSRSGRPLLGVCLGMQLLLDESEEFGRHEGLGLLAGRVRRLPEPAPGSRDKIPNVGWCRLEPAAEGSPWANSLFANAKAGDFAYFVHSYVSDPDDSHQRLAEIVFAGHRVVAAITAGPVAGCQFHPEKSGEVGLAILAAFVNQP